MGLKRSSTEADSQPILAMRQERTRAERSSDSSTSSSSEASASALESSPVASAETETAATSTSSVASDDETSDSSSSSSEDEEIDSDSDSEMNDQDQEESTEREHQPPEIVTLGRPNQKPSMDPERVQTYAKDLQARLEEFMPRLRQANSELATKGSNLNMEHVADDEQHIEMNLGLGVLEQRGEEANASEDIITRPRAESSDGSDADVAGETDSGPDVMSRLLKVPKTQGKASIQELSDAEKQ